jgi:hypothetical protein
MVFHADHLTSINDSTHSSGFAIHMRLDDGLDETITTPCVVVAPAAYIFDTSPTPWRPQLTLAICCISDIFGISSSHRRELGTVTATPSASTIMC